jgi:hypothetical protein
MKQRGRRFFWALAVFAWCGLAAHFGKPGIRSFLYKRPGYFQPAVLLPPSGIPTWWSKAADRARYRERYEWGYRHGVARLNIEIASKQPWTLAGAEGYRDGHRAGVTAATAYERRVEQWLAWLP